MNHDTNPALRSPWHAGWFSPLNLATYITWLAVLLQSLRWNLLVAGDSGQWGGVLALLGMLGAYRLTGLRQRDDAYPQLRERVLVVIQALLVLGATWLVGNGGPAILLIIVAGQAVAIWPTRVALAGMLLTLSARAADLDHAVAGASLIAGQRSRGRTAHDLAGAGVELRTVPGADDVPAVDPTVDHRGGQVRAELAHRGDVAVVGAGAQEGGELEIGRAHV